ncbi:RagB/SusD family nutrient uptake outer membrane protein [uncultured Prevotella sp.]|uniref:RagB/SusD family nutrient uptake outer membrane protein n=1 Tax=uncultured Prevotella sp. TaxID=159272 RepID=UPI0025E71254|nr:RagB/SusD family nutrient uptake outer membrane protein [uncultured Prevotella sp.]
MKFNKIAILLLSAGLLTTTSCDFMDCDESDNYTLQEIQSSYNRVKQFVTSIYGYLPSDFCNTHGAMLDAATDDAIHVYESSAIQRIVNGTWSANYTVDDKFAYYYNAIHDANYYLTTLSGLTFDTWENGDDYQDWMQNYDNYQYQVRFLRAYFYFELVRRYQNVPLITKPLSQTEANQIEPSSAQEVLKFIINECTEIAPKLPIKSTSIAQAENGRATRAMAMALKSRAALYAASPLYNTNGDNAKWTEAAKASHDIIASAGELGLGLDTYANLFKSKNYNSKEVILCRPTGTSKTFEQANYPMGVTGGNTTTCPTENLASAFEMKDGRAFDWNDPTMKANPYKDRDPRFYLTIVHNGMLWPAKKAVDISEGGANGLPLTNATTTGYYLRKYVDNSISFEAGSTTAATHHNWILFRYAEVLLNYAEAMIHVNGNCDFKDATYTMSAREALNAVRKRAGMPEVAACSQDEFLTRVKHERRVEMAFEGQRFWDLRRWKNLDETKNIYAVRITHHDGVLSYEKTLLSERSVSDKLYFYPIANVELFKNKKLVQNSGWDK